MNAELTKSLTEVVDFTKEGIVKGLSIIQTEAPELCQQILTYHFWIYLLGSLFIIPTLFLLLYSIKKVIKIKDFDHRIDWILCGFVSLIFGVVLCVETISVFIQICIAPKLFLIEYVSNLLT